MMQFDIVTIFPEIVRTYTDYSIIKRARESKAISVNVHNLREYSPYKHRNVDDRPYGGGAGMIMMIEPLYRAITLIKGKNSEANLETKVILTSASGRLFTQNIAKKLSKECLSETGNIAYLIICGHYGGVDERIKLFIDYELSVGPYILTGGELPALIMLDTITRLVPGVLGNSESLKNETLFTLNKASNNTLVKIEGAYPQYTRPELFEYVENGVRKSAKVPKVLLSGDHNMIKKFRYHKTGLIFSCDCAINPHEK